MNIISADSSAKLGLWIVVEPEENEVIMEGTFEHTYVGKILLENTTIKKVGEQYHITYEDVSLPGHTEVYDHVAMFHAHALSPYFENINAVEHGCLPSDFPAPMIKKMQEAIKDKGQTLTANELFGKLTINIFEKEELVATFEAPTAEAYLDYLVSGLPRAKNFYDHRAKTFGHYGNDKTEAYVEQLNDKLSAAANAVGVPVSYAFFDANALHFVVGFRNGRSTVQSYPGCILNFLEENQIEVPFEVITEENSFAFGSGIEKVLPAHILHTMRNLNKWPILQLIGKVR
ncbi:hypothetical protein JA33_033 [Dickeya phage vB_DsoM_JA33]|uniref:Uncharacterized protein n=2 Tax=Salmondvirus JA11 TaxID=2734141 RepID=A0A386K521_9CAUD|nr:hypothetical protein HOU32_gp033 [Dickeya phage vB_DsoM_JA11]AXG67407.1 hypothetical protein JA33_033 [Dickeya phage vB_DsoM_JA33]AYD79838.1 hypothetical protein JA11_033 [Dickeya phage vB_DsoM_JA11]